MNHSCRNPLPTPRNRAAIASDARRSLVVLLGCTALLFGCTALLHGCTGAGPREVHSPPEAKTRPSPAKPSVSGPPAAPGTAPELALSKAGMDCLTENCFRVRNFPAISTSGHKMLVFEVRGISAAIGGGLEEYEEISVKVLDARTGRVIKTYPLVAAADHYDLHQSVQDPHCVDEVNRTGHGDPRLCRQDPDLVAEEKPRFKATLQARIAAVQAELAKDHFEALVKIGKSENGKPPADCPGGLFFEEKPDCVPKVVVKESETGKDVATILEKPAGDAGCDEGPTYITGVWYGPRNPTFLVSLSQPGSDGDTVLSYHITKRAP
ncbi:hypothetical protein KKD52_16855 [Myxococcota bacterium]|nr:hypothetical protein [Myxococcota bacterium]MBU1410201.1 hypothetical protein [Myxococcota bacterium]MBU1512026.1 hypothetical protein [Myxococcota bacterium]